MSRKRTILLLAGLVAAPMLFAQDVMVFTDGERLVGKFVRSNGGSAVFKSDAIGEITVDWSKVKELQSSQAFAVIPKNVVLKRGADTAKIPEGTISVADQKVTVTPAPGQPNAQPQTVAVADTDHLIDTTTFNNELQHNPSFFADWGGTVTAGATLVQSTQESRAYNVAINLVRTVPDADWLHRRNRTIVNFSTAYGTLSQPDTPTVKTDIYHAGIERDEYFSAAFYGFAQATFDHNFSQGLDLQQTYGGGIGWSVIKRPNESLDLKAGVTYIRQDFAGTSTRSVEGSIFEEDYQRGLARGIKFNQTLIVIPAWSNTDALTASGSAVLTMPVYKRMNFSIGAIDNYLHDPPEGFKKNSFQATMGLTYSLR
jgi:putative salt-induced outer membrane protein YdiY